MRYTGLSTPTFHLYFIFGAQETTVRRLWDSEMMTPSSRKSLIWSMLSRTLKKILTLPKYWAVTKVCFLTLPSGVWSWWFFFRCCPNVWVHMGYTSCQWAISNTLIKVAVQWNKPFHGCKYFCKISRWEGQIDSVDSGVLYIHVTGNLNGLLCSYNVIALLVDSSIASAFFFLAALSFPRRSSLSHSSSRCFFRRGMFFISALQRKHVSGSFKIGSYFVGLSALTCIAAHQETRKIKSF